MRKKQVLIFDADDTLWENNIRFERVIADFLDWLAHPTLDRAEIRAVLDDIEAANAVTHGYGSSMFLRSLGECFERLHERPTTFEEQREINELAAALVDHRVELLPGVSETLDNLGGRHKMLLLTKGDVEEQRRKLEASDLGHHFESIHIVPEKNVDTYQRLVDAYGFTPSRTWMIGNSPKSDVIPARRAGMNAVFIPNAHTWSLEQSELDPSDERVLRLSRFPELMRHF
ncbi:HAD family hydrolase [Amycolatopsis aidingensis]|uniref:HAD family hydrolase n=1 Tax=Amycolatopsis aidingensis TaxID=2842453 RepID=UPI001C0ACC83|nr:HAD family hydrolase [Amycolatopsis aidingensis]